MQVLCTHMKLALSWMILDIICMYLKLIRIITVYNQTDVILGIWKQLLGKGLNWVRVIYLWCAQLWVAQQTNYTISASFDKYLLHLSLYESWSFHGNEYLVCCLLGYYTMYSLVGMGLPPTWKWRQHVLPKHW